MNLIWSVLQLAGLLAVLAGVALLLPLGAALVVDGVLVVATATAAEVVARRPPGRAQDRRSRAQKAGAV